MFIDMKKNQVSNAKRLIVRYIREIHLSRGDKLPSHLFFRQQFGFGMTTIVAAIDELKEDGIVDVRKKVGAFLLNPEVEGHYAYEVGILVSHWVHESPYYCSLLTTIHMNLAQAGCKVNFFYSKEPKAKDLLYVPLKDFPGLKRCMSSNSIDALIHMDLLKSEEYELLESYGIPLLYIGLSLSTPKNSYLFYDTEKLLKTICQKLNDFGAKHPALHLSGSISKLAEIFKKNTFGNGIVFESTNYSKIDNVTSAFINLPQEQRPDFLVFLDDLGAQKVLCDLATRLARSDMPKVFIVQNKQLYLNYPVSDPTLYTIDLNEISTCAISILLNNLKKGELDFGCRYHMEF